MKAWIRGYKTDDALPKFKMFSYESPEYPKMVDVLAVYSQDYIEFQEGLTYIKANKDDWDFELIYHTGYRDFYSGDIIELWKDLDRSWSAGRGYVEWCQNGIDGPGYVIRGQDGEIKLFENWKKYEKIGNIYENPELIKE